MNESDDSAPQSEDRDARLARAAMKSLAVAAPADLKAELKRRARGLGRRAQGLGRRAQGLGRPRSDFLAIWLGRRAPLSGTWAYGAGAALAAAVVAVVILRAVPKRPKAVETFIAVPPSALADLWADDDGKDDDDS